MPEGGNLKQKISFAVEDIDVLDDLDGSQFATIKIDAFASGNNRHSLYVSEETLKKTAKTILHKPLVWDYNKFMDDAGNHSEYEVPCGFVPKDTPIEFRRMPDSRVMMTVTAKLWKRYSGKLFDIFKRGDRTKSVSVEMEVIEYGDNKELGLTELLDFCYLCITILGDTVVQAIPMAKAEMVEFAVKESASYDEAVKKEFSSDNSSYMAVPEVVKYTAEKALEKHKSLGVGITSVDLATARYLVNNDKISPSKARQIAKYFSSHKNSEELSFSLWGGECCRSWISDVIYVMEFNDNALKFERLTFPYKSEGDMNPALRGINPPISVEQGNAIARQADAIGADKGGWGIAISHFKKTHKVVDGRWVEINPQKEKTKEELSVDEKEEMKKEEMAETPAEEAKESPEEEKAETPEEEKKEDMSLDMNLDLSAMLAMLEDETEEYAQMSQEAKDGKVNYSKLCNAMYTKMCNMKASLDKMSADCETYMSENASLREFKAQTEAKEYAFEVEKVLNEVSETMPKEKVEEAREDSKNFALDSLDAWRNKVKAVAFSYVKNSKKDDGIVRMGMPFANTGEITHSIWKR